MTSNHSFFNFKFFKQTVKQNIWLLVMVILGFIVTQITPIAFSVQQYISEKNSIEISDSISNVARLSAWELHNIQNIVSYHSFCVVAMLFAILSGVSTFSYLHSSKKTDFFHSIPVSRECIFISKYLTNIIFVIPTYIISTMICIIIVNNANLIDNNLEVVKMSFPVMMVIQNLVLYILSNAVAIIATILTGNTMLAVILSLVFLSVHEVLMMLKEVIIDTFLPTILATSSKVVLDINGNIVVNSVSDILNAGFFQNFFNAAYMKMNVIIGYFVISILCLVVAFFLFKIRKSEGSSSSVAFRSAKPILKYLLVNIYAIFSGVLYYLYSGYSEIGLLFGVVFVGTIAHCIIEIIYEADFKAVFKNWVGIIICIIISSAVLFGCKYDVLGISNKLPNPDKVASVILRGVSYNNFPEFSADPSHYYYEYFDLSNSSTLMIKDRATIDTALEVHSNFLDEKKSDFDYSTDYGVLEIKYYDENSNYLMGRKVSIPSNSDDLYNLVNSAGYMETNLYFFGESFENATTSNQGLIDKNLGFSKLSDDEMDMLISNLRTDIAINGVMPRDEEYVYMLSAYITSTTDNIENTSGNEKLKIYESYENTISYIENNIDFKKANTDNIRYIGNYIGSFTIYLDKNSGSNSYTGGYSAFNPENGYIYQNHYMNDVSGDSIEILLDNIEDYGKSSNQIEFIIQVAEDINNYSRSDLELIAYVSEENFEKFLKGIDEELSDIFRSVK